MTAAAIGLTTIRRSIPLISIDMFKNWRASGVDTSRLVVNGTPADQDAALAQYILSASDWSYGICLQTLAATSDTELKQVWVNRLGFAEIAPRFRPIVGVTEVSLGTAPSQLSPLASLSQVGVEPDRITVPVGPSIPWMSSQGPIQFGAVVGPMDGAWVQYTYVNGFPVTYLADDAESGATSISVEDTTGIVPNRSWLTVYAGARQFRFQVGEVSTAGSVGLGTGPGTVEILGTPLPWAIRSNAQYPTMVSALPGDAVEAIQLATRGLIKQTQTSSVSAATTTGAQVQRDPLGAGDDLARAERMLVSGEYVVPVA